MTTISEWATQHGFSNVERKDKGRTAYVYSAIHTASKRKVALKVVHEKNRRKNSIEREAQLLQQLNPFQLGPTLYAIDPLENVLVMEWIEGLAFREWVLDSNPSKSALLHVIESLMHQAQQLDDLRIDHGQLAGRGQNILIRRVGKNVEPVIIDFEKASTVRRCHNVSQLASFLFYSPSGVLAIRLRERLGPDWFESIPFVKNSRSLPNP